MSLWLALVALAACAAALVAFPFLRPRAQAAQDASGTDVHKQQLQELASEQAAGEVDAETAANERIAIERRILAETPRVTETVATPRADRATAIGIVAVVVLGAVALYAATGEPSIPSSTHSVDANASIGMTATVAPPPQHQLPDVDTMITRLADRMKKSPNDPEGWRMLGWSYFETQHYPQSVDAYAHAVTLKPNMATYQSAYGEAQVLASNGKVTDGALKAFNATLTSAPHDERAYYYVGLAKSQKGDAAGAIGTWLVALKAAAPDSLWGPRLRTQIEQQAHTAGIDVSSQLPRPSAAPATTFAGPTAQDVQQAQAMSPEERQAMITNMVEGLDQRLRQNPADPDGWVRLIRSRKVMGRPDLAHDALSRAMVAFAGDLATKQKIAAAAEGLGVTMDR